MVRALINWQVTDLLEHTRQRLRQESIATVHDVRQAPEALIVPGPEVRALKADLAAHRQFATIEETLRYAEAWIQRLSPQQALRKSGLLSPTFWLHRQ